MIEEIKHKQMNANQLKSLELAADYEAFIKSGGKPYQCKRGESASPESVSGAERAKARSSANKKNGRLPKCVKVKFNNPYPVNAREF